MRKNFLNFNSFPFFNALDLDLFETLPRESQIQNYVMSEDDNSYSVSMTVPGLSKNEIDIDLDKNIISISYDETKFEKENKFTKSFSKKFKLPDDSDFDNIEAKVKNGVLDVKINKKTYKKDKKIIEIQ